MNDEEILFEYSQCADSRRADSKQSTQTAGMQRGLQFLPDSWMLTSEVDTRENEAVSQPRSTRENLKASASRGRHVGTSSGLQSLEADRHLREPREKLSGLRPRRRCTESMTARLCVHLRACRCSCQFVFSQLGRRPRHILFRVLRNACFPSCVHVRVCDR